MHRAILPGFTMVNDVYTERIAFGLRWLGARGARSPREPRDQKHTLFRWYENWGERGFWQGYHSLAQQDARLAEWEICVKVPPAPFDAPAGRKVIEFAPERVHWLWQGRLALGKLTILEGDPGKG